MKNTLIYLIFGISIVLLSAFSVAAPPLEFDNQTQESRFNKLVAELRCLVCQNQNLADSDAELAQDLRREVLDLIRSGKSDTQVKDFLVQRYGEFVLYRPRLDKSTYLLWLGPAVFFLIAAVVIGLVIGKRNQQFLENQNMPNNKDQKPHDD
ncbi:MAG: cytochrome c-type biogenesis protein CcmH [Xanthomonadales bacterium]|nr:cytochrome c-type biogenesis protein CcmH [Xanthomonadales bacterium]